MGGFCPLVELHREGSAPGACAVGLFFLIFYLMCDVLCYVIPYVMCYVLWLMWCDMCYVIFYLTQCSQCCSKNTFVIHSFIHSFSWWSLTSKPSKHHYTQPEKVMRWNLESMFTPHHVSHIMCQDSGVTYKIIIIIKFFCHKIVWLVVEESVINDAYLV